jgi:hypothetical protein
MKLSDLIPDPEIVIALEPDELGLRMLPVLAAWPKHDHLEQGRFVEGVIGDGRTRGVQGQYPPGRGADIKIALIEAWALA